MKHSQRDPSTVIFLLRPALVLLPFLAIPTTGERAVVSSSHMEVVVRIKTTLKSFKNATVDVTHCVGSFIKLNKN